MFIAMAGAQLALSTGTTRAPTPVDHPDAHFLAPAFVQTLARLTLVDPIFAPVMQGAADSLGKLVDRKAIPLQDPSRHPKGSSFLV